MKKWIRVLPILGVAVLAAGIGHQSALAKKSEDSVIADRIFIGDVAVGVDGVLCISQRWRYLL